MSSRAPLIGALNIVRTMHESGTPPHSPQAAVSCAAELDSTHLPSVDEAIEQILLSISPLTERENVALDSASFRVLAHDIHAPMASPPYTNSAMDGFALRLEDLQSPPTRPQKIVGQSQAGHPFIGSVKQGECIHITTGALVPDECNCVVMQEYTVQREDQVFINKNCRPNDNIRQAGEDVQQGDKVLAQGDQLTPAAIGMLASIGVETVEVFRLLKAAVFSTGDELVSLGSSLPKGQGKIYDSNRLTSIALLRRLGIEVVMHNHLPDKKETIMAQMRQASQTCDISLSSGGVSVGKADYVKDTLATLGKIILWKIAMKPGRPVVFAKIGQAWHFGLPGNPVSVLVAFYVFVRPALQKLSGMVPQPLIELEAISSDDLPKRPGRTEFQRGVFTCSPVSGKLEVRNTGEQGSGIISSVTKANCFIRLPAEMANVRRGDMVRIVPFSTLV